MKKARKVRLVNDAALTSALLTQEKPVVFADLKGFEVQAWTMAILITFIYYM